MRESEASLHNSLILSLPKPIIMKQLSDAEEKPFTSSLNICPEVCWKRRGCGRRIASPSPAHYFPTDPWIFRYKTTLSLLTSSVFPSRRPVIKSKWEVCLIDFFHEDGVRRASLSGGTKEKDDLSYVSYSSWPCSPEFIYQRRYMSRILALDLLPVPIFM
jgi:hypothetical protein